MALSAARTSSRPAVWLDEGGLLRSGGAWLALPDKEWRLIEMLLARRGRVVWRDELVAQAWPDGDVTEGALRGAMGRLRRRVGVFGVRIHAVRGRGFILTFDQRGLR